MSRFISELSVALVRLRMFKPPVILGGALFADPFCYLCLICLHDSAVLPVLFSLTCLKKTDHLALLCLICVFFLLSHIVSRVRCGIPETWLLLKAYTC